MDMTETGHGNAVIVSFNFLPQAVQKGSFWAGLLWEPFDVRPQKKNDMRTTPIGFTFHQLSDFCFGVIRKKVKTWNSSARKTVE